MHLNAPAATLRSRGGGATARARPRRRNGRTVGLIAAILGDRSHIDLGRDARQVVEAHATLRDLELTAAQEDLAARVQRDRAAQAESPGCYGLQPAFVG